MKEIRIPQMQSIESGGYFFSIDHSTDRCHFIEQLKEAEEQRDREKEIRISQRL